VFVVAYLWTMFWGALSATAKVDGVIGLVVAAVTVLAGFSLVPEPTAGEVGVWLAISFLIFFALEFLVLTPARTWQSQRLRGPSPSVTFEQGSISPGATVIVYGPVPGQLPLGFDVRPALLDEPDDDPADTDTAT
jgi:hypothetical protein